MNRIFRTVWNAALASWVAVGEIGVLPRATSHTRRRRRLTGHRGDLKLSAPAPLFAATLLAAICAYGQCALAQNQPSGTINVYNGDVVSIIGGRANASTGTYTATQMPGNYIFQEDGAKLNFRGGYYRNTGYIEVAPGVTATITGGASELKPNSLFAPESTSANVLLYNPSIPYQLILRKNAILDVSLYDGSSDHFGLNYLMFTNNGNYSRNGSNYLFEEGAKVRVTSGGFRLDPYTHDRFNLSNIIFNGGYFSTRDGDDIVYADQDGQAVGYVELGKGADLFVVNSGVNIVGQEKGNKVKMYETKTGDAHSAHLINSQSDADAGNNYDNPNDRVELRSGSSATGINFDFGNYDDTMEVYDGARLVNGTVDMGSGNDTFTANADSAGRYAVDLGDGSYIDTGAGNDQFVLNGSTFRGAGTSSAAAVRMQAGDDTVSLNGATVLGVTNRTSIDMGTGNDTMNVSGATLQGAAGGKIADFGAGNDTMNLTRARLNDTAVAMNTGTNAVNVLADDAGGTTIFNGNTTFTRSGTTTNSLNVMAGATALLTDGSTVDFAGQLDARADSVTASPGSAQLNTVNGAHLRGTVQIGTVGADGQLTLNDTSAVGVQAHDGAHIDGRGLLRTSGMALDGTVNADVADDQLLAYQGMISGAGSLAKNDGGTLRLEGANTYSGGTTINGGTVMLAHQDAAGTGALDVHDSTRARFAFSGTPGTWDAAFDNDVSGAGTVTVEGADVDLAGDNANFRGQWQILQDASARAKAEANLGTAAIDLSGRLELAPETGGFTLDNALTGGGTLAAQMGSTNNEFAFGPNAGTAFTGAFEMGRGTLDLSGDNTAALANARLNLNDESTTTVGNGTQSVRGVGIHGGTVIFDASAPDHTRAQSMIDTAALDASDTGTIRITVPGPYVPSAPGTPNTANLLEQDDANIGVKLIDARQVTGSGGALVLEDQNGTAVGPIEEIDVAQNGDVVARGTYAYRLSTAPGDGLYANYGLHELDLQDGRTLTFTPAPGSTGAAADMSARVTGTGSLAIDAGADTVSLSNVTNDYTGETTVQTGTLRLASDHALGDTSVLKLHEHTAAQMGGYEQSIGELQADAGSTLDLQQGRLSIEHGGYASGTLQGAGELSANGGVLTIDGANPELSAQTYIAQGAVVSMNDAGGLGIGTIADNGALAIHGASGTLANAVSGVGSVDLHDGATVAASGDNSSFSGRFGIDQGTTLSVQEAQHLGTATVMDGGTLRVANASEWTLGNTVQGAGSLVKDGPGTLAVGDATGHTGETQVNAGTLLVGDEMHASRMLGGTGAGEVTVARGATLAGSGTVNGHVTNTGTVSALNALRGEGSAANGNFTLGAGLTNTGAVNLAGPSGSAPGNTLTINGDYVGNGGQLTIRTVMGDDASPTDKLVIVGGNASGSTGVVVRAAGGGGAQTTQGIRVVEAREGATTEAAAFNVDPASDGYRQGVGSIAAGAYDYNLVRGGSSGAANDWYLVSQHGIVPADVNGEVPGVGAMGGTGRAAAPRYRPEVGTYMNNRAFASSMSMHTLRDRQGQQPDATADSDGKPGAAAAWARVVGSTSRRDGAGALQSRDNSFLVHAGSDLLRFGDGREGSIRAGVMGASGHSNNTSNNGEIGARGNVTGYNLGVYGTWYGHRDILTGPYADAWLMAGRYDNQVSGQGLAPEKYRSHTLTGSLEGGYALKVYDAPRRQIFVIPQAQVVAQRYSGGTHLENTGTSLSDPSATTTSARLGVRVHANLEHVSGKSQVRPFVEVNWLRGPSDQTMLFNGAAVREALPANRAEAKLGIQGNVGKRTSMYGHISGQTSAQGYRSGGAQIGVKHNW